MPRRERHVVEMTIDGAPERVTICAAHWLPGLLGADATAIGTSIYLAQPLRYVTLWLMGHELVHVQDFTRLRARTWRQMTWLATGWDLARYVCDWMRAAFRYSAMREELLADARAQNIAAGLEETIDIVPVALLLRTARETT